ncbi:hypothetical protein DFH28DRAFT_903172 [Melampsora americana]|nr:hypothetical protein DFH28DRAFT_903172 [Melampsora americana]
MASHIHLSFQFPLRFSSIFWTKDEIISAAEHSDRFRFFETNIIINQNGLHGISLKIAAQREQSELQARHAYRIDGQVAMWGARPILLEDFATTIAIDHAEVRPNCMVNKVSAQGVGQIVEWSADHGSVVPHEVIKVLHRCWNFTQSQHVDFHVNWVLSTHLTSPLTINALTEGNIISLRGNVVSYVDNIWEIQVSNQFI